MANHPKKVKDPTEVALSAIQEALNIGDASAPAENDRVSAHNDLSSANSLSTTSYDDSAFGARPRGDRPAFEPIAEARSTRRAANDDRETIGQILQALQKGRPARSVYTLATLFAGVWIAGCVLLTFSFFPGSYSLMVPMTVSVLVFFVSMPGALCFIVDSEWTFSPAIDPQAHPLPVFIR